MREPKMHFERIPVETVKKIAKQVPEDDVTPDDAASAEAQGEDGSPQERWREVAQKVKQEKDPTKMIGLVQELIANFDDEQLHKRLPRNQDTQKPSGDSSEDKS